MLCKRLRPVRARTTPHRKLSFFRRQTVTPCVRVASPCLNAFALQRMKFHRSTSQLFSHLQVLQPCSFALVVFDVATTSSMCYL